MTHHQVKQRGEKKQQMTGVTLGNTRTRLNQKHSTAAIKHVFLSPEDTSQRGNDDKVKFLKFRCDSAD